MTPLEKLKAEAATLEETARASGRPIRHSAALEQVARAQGYDSWRACVAILKAAEEAGPVAALPVMKRYVSPQWGFEIDVPVRWNSFPAVGSNSPYEVIRFASREDGNHWLIIFREPWAPDHSAEEHLAGVREALASRGYGDFVLGETAVGDAPVKTLDFEKTTEIGPWSCRYYLLTAETLGYILGFGTNRKDQMLGLFDRMAESFVFQPSSWAEAG